MTREGHKINNGTPAPAGDSLTDKVPRLETQEIRAALRGAGGVKSRAARDLGISERMLSYKMKLYGLRPDAGGRPGAAGS